MCVCVCMCVRMCVQVALAPSARVHLQPRDPYACAVRKHKKHTLDSLLAVIIISRRRGIPRVTLTSPRPAKWNVFRVICHFYMNQKSTQGPISSPVRQFSLPLTPPPSLNLTQGNKEEKENAPMFDTHTHTHAHTHKPEWMVRPQPLQQGYQQPRLDPQARDDT